MATENKEDSGTMVVNLRYGTSESGKVFLRGEIFLEEPITRLDLAQEWIDKLESILLTIQKPKAKETK